MRLKTYNVQLNQIQLNILISMSDLLEQRAREPTEKKKTSVNAFSIHKATGHEYKTVKTNIYKFKELKNVS